MIYQLLKLDLKRTTHQKYLCSSVDCAEPNKREMLMELCHTLGLLLIGSKDKDPIVEDKDRSRFRLKYHSDGRFHWFKIYKYNAKTMDRIDNIFTD